MSEIIEKEISATEAQEASKNENKEAKSTEFKFFKNCSASLKKLSVIMFVINIFFAVAVTGVAVVLLAVYINTAMLSILALPIITIFIILIVIARFISALIYGFAEIVEKHEKN